MITFTLAKTRTPDFSHHGIVLIVILNWLICLLRKVQVPLVGSYYVGTAPARMISQGDGALPYLHRGTGPTCQVSYILFSHTHEYVQSIPPGILSAIGWGKWWTFLVHLGGCISDPYVSMHKATSIISAYSPGLSQPASAEANTYFSNVSAAIYILPSNLKLRTKLDICIDDVPPSICIDVLGWRPPNYFLFSLLQLQSIEASGFIGYWFQFVVLDKNGPLLMLRKM